MQLEGGLGNRQTRDANRLASQGFQVVLEMEVASYRAVAPSLPEPSLSVEFTGQYTIPSIPTAGTVNQTSLGASSYGELDGYL
jgi:hypothetical protein